MKLTQAAHILGCLLIVTLAGCASEQESLHEHDHHEPEHWPESMEEAADFIAGRVEVLNNSSQLEGKRRNEVTSELRDLVEWAPEIAADAGMRESDWLPIYELSEAIRSHMQSSDVDPNDFADDFNKLCQLLRTTQVDAANN